jgi:hypothetical protein
MIMAFTYEELELWLPGHSIYSDIECTLVITQEDGRTAYVSGSIDLVNVRREHFGGDYFYMQFSDRRTQFRLNGSLFDQNFTVQGDTIEKIQLEFHKTAANTFGLKLINPRWGSTDNIILTKAASAKVYTGWGITIGNGTGQALYAFSINSAVESPG